MTLAAVALDSAFVAGICLCCGAMALVATSATVALDAALSSLTFALDADVLATVALDSAFAWRKILLL